MKKHLLIATGLAVLSTSAYATKARMQALGQGAERGSFYLEDTRNVFRNASAVNQFKNYVLTEWGSNASTTGADAEGTPDAEGGFFKEHGSMAYGVYLGSELSAQNTSTRTSSGFLAQDNTVNLFVGGDAGIEWGARILYSSNKDEQTTTFEKKQSALGVGLGITMGDLEAWANIDLSDESEGNTAAANNKWEADTGLHIGASYGMGDMTFFAEYDKTGHERTISSAKTEDSTSMITVGAARVHETSSSSRVFYDIKYTNWKNEVKTGGTTTETKATNLPVTIGFEADATKWLTLRGSISQDVFINNTENNAGKKKDDADSTSVAAGATLNFGKLKVDGMIGNDDGTTTKAGKLRLDQLMSRVAVHYWF